VRPFFLCRDEDFMHVSTAPGWNTSPIGVSATARRIAILGLLGLLLWVPAFAEAPRQISWQDLLPAAPQVANPFAKLTLEQRRALADIASLRERRARGDTTISDIERADEDFLIGHLRQSGIDADALLATREQMLAQQRNLARAVNPALNGAVIRIAGYLLPLEYSGKHVSEFLLVPWVGACIHTPPPPANQIVHVKLERPVEYDGLFKPIWVTGRLSAAAARKSLFLIDGESDIDVSYGIQGTKVEPFVD